VDWRALLRNKWAWGGIAVAAAAGGYVLYKKRGNPDFAAGAGAQASPAYSAGAVGGFDSSGTDIAHWLGSQEGVLSDQMREFLAQVQASQDLAPVPTGSSGGTGLPPTTPTRRIPIPVPPTAPVSVRRPPTRRT
jgi:hypothetical protein